MDKGDIQGLVFGSYARQPFSAALLVRFGAGDASGWLRRWIAEVSSSERRERQARSRLNLALTSRGLAGLGLPAATLAGFAQEFRQGMAHPERSRVLGDSGEDAPAHWEFHDGPDGGVDALVLVYAVTPRVLEEKLDALDASFERFGLDARELATYLPADGGEHFGFRMGVSEPSIRGRRRRGQMRAPLGEFLLGHANGYGVPSPSPRAPRLRSTREPPRLVDGAARVDFGFNGSYLVVRKLEQRVHAFWRFVRGAAFEQGLADPEQLAARLIGRWPNGAPLTLHPEAPPAVVSSKAERFGYASDAAGERCPLGAHVRRAYPRDALTGGVGRLPAASLHRLLRRGRLYGPRLEDRFAAEDGVERGLLFVALNADLGRQFEAVQGSYLNGPSASGASLERDPLVGGGPRRQFSDAGEPVRRLLVELPKFVRVRGGAYFFLPSVSALGYLADLKREEPALLRPSS